VTGVAESQSSPETPVTCTLAIGYKVRFFFVARRIQEKKKVREECAVATKLERRD